MPFHCKLSLPKSSLSAKLMNKFDTSTKAVMRRMLLIQIFIKHLLCIKQLCKCLGDISNQNKQQTLLLWVCILTEQARLNDKHFK